ncbi:MAG TPA: FKBP-type peptidyl-prolyl cis-trans isomerase [Candidatus Krumholzibacteria bacterium]|nr:FKBP-type peptidyl-prolyl cis-trans isomerase [Candidatus Krumholzibacteria bacterium]HPD72603.1 FKBP-type peptidyl-prolyl cis-trans isomerase [Candidatus Krumholzibacteria bacterium]HRY40465.1 FKBP-type peptidyl-prolyl cis-trans isomerase [Candidatus Krumholzibacteria bacterium]
MRTVLPILLPILLAVAIGGCGDPVQRALERDQLYVEDLQVGTGAEAVAGDFVRVGVRGAVYADGELGLEVENTGDDPRRFVLGAAEVMPGWDEGIAGMRVGGRRVLIVGPQKITGPFRPRAVAADEYLRYEIELLETARIGVRDLAPGDGPPIGVGDYVFLEYTGWQAAGDQRGEQFVSSGSTGGPAGVMVGAGMLNRGLELGVAGMRVGGRREITVPPQLAYGDQGRAQVPPDATLIYEVAVVSRPTVGVKTLREGTGEPAGTGERLLIHLSGWIRQPDGSRGEPFQDSRKFGQPLAIFLGSFKIQPGLELGIRGMRPGELRELDVPAPLAFGKSGWYRADRVIVPPDTDVIYEVERIDPSQPPR